MSSKSISWAAPGSRTTCAAGSSGEEALPQAEIATAAAISASVAAGGATALRRRGRHPRQLFDHLVSRAQRQGRDGQRRIDPERGGNACPIRDVKTVVEPATGVEDVAELVADAGGRRC